MTWIILGDICLELAVKTNYRQNSCLFTKVCLHYLVTWPILFTKVMTRIIQGDLCLEKAYKAILSKSSNTTTTIQQFKSLEVRAVLLALKNQKWLMVSFEHMNFWFIQRKRSKKISWWGMVSSFEGLWTNFQIWYIRWKHMTPRVHIRCHFGYNIFV